jgi:hypothetical protein
MSVLGNLNANGAIEPTLDEVLADLDKFTFLSTRLLVDGSQVTQPVSGTFWPATQPISGSVDVSNFPLTYPVTGPLTDAELRDSAVPVSGTVTADQGTSPWVISGTVATVPGSIGIATVSRIAVTNTGAVTLSLSNAAKTQVVIYNESGTLFVKYGTGASLTDNTYVLPPNSTVEVNGYYGLITARKASGNSFVDITEVGI